jgi:hypothetical protein
MKDERLREFIAKYREDVKGCTYCHAVFTALEQLLPNEPEPLEILLQVTMQSPTQSVVIDWGVIKVRLDMGKDKKLTIGCEL